MEKWIAIVLACWAMAVGLDRAVYEYSKGQCRIAALQRGISAAEIASICR